MAYLKENDSTAEAITPNSPSTRLQPESTHQELGNEKVVSKETSAALDSDLPNDVLIDNDHRLITSDNYPPTNPLTANDLHTCVTPTEENFGGSDREQEADDDEFGNFDSDDDGFGSFDDNQGFDDDFNTLPIMAKPEHTDNTPIFNTLEEALEIWTNLLNQLYKYQPLENFTQSASKSIRQYVLEEAPESLHSRLTWDSVTRQMDNDTGIPKVRWYLSEIEKLHLNALSCQRSTKLPASTIVSATDHKPDPIDTSWSNNDLTPTNYQPSPPIEYNSNQTTPTSEKRSSVFGLSSLSRYLPHLSKSNLPRSPTSPVSPSSNSSFHSTIPKERTSYEHPLPPSSPLSLSDNRSQGNNTTSSNNTSFSGSFNHMNIQTKTSHQLKSTPSSIKRSNTVAFSSRFSSPILDISSSPPSPTILSSKIKPRPTSFHTNQQQKMDLFDLNVEPDSILKSPVTSEFNTSFKPLIPTFNSTPLSPTVYSPASSSAAATTHVAASSIPADDDFGEFGSFAVQKEETTQDPFGDFFSTSKKPPSSVKRTENEDDPFGLNSVMQMSASNIKPKPVILKPSSDMMLSPTKVPSTTADYNTRLASMFEVPAVSDQTEEDDWGDWTF